MTPATSGTPATRTPRSACSTRTPGRSPSTRCPTRRRRTRTPRSSIADGILWFTLQQSNMIGRLDPASGDIRLVTMPTPDAKPYGIKIDADGTPWVACNGSNCLVRVDPQTMALTEIELPIPETTVRRLDIADGRHDLVRQLLARAARPLRSEDRRDQGVAIAERARTPTPTRSRSWTASSGTTNWASGRTRWSASTRGPRPSRAGRSRRATSTPASSATCARPGTATS